MSTPDQPDSRFAVCIGNEGYPASLEVRKIYRVINDQEAEQHDLVRVIDESGEDYLYPGELFVLISLPDAAANAFRAAS